MKKGAKKTEEVRVADLVLFLWKVCQKNFPQTFVNVGFIIHKKRKVAVFTVCDGRVSDHKRTYVPVTLPTSGSNNDDSSKVKMLVCNVLGPF